VATAPGAEEDYEDQDQSIQSTLQLSSRPNSVFGETDTAGEADEDPEKDLSFSYSRHEPDFRDGDDQATEDALTSEGSSSRFASYSGSRVMSRSAESSHPDLEEDEEGDENLTSFLLGGMDMAQTQDENEDTRNRPLDQEAVSGTHVNSSLDDESMVAGAGG
jgi:hypothetical protein